MICCGCKAIQKEIPFKGTRIHVCPQCGSRTAALRDILSRVNDKALEVFWSKIMAASPAESGKPCPGCRAKMQVINVPVQSGKLELDLCGACQLMWFDPGEMDQLNLMREPVDRAPKGPVLSAAVKKESDFRDRVREQGIDPDIGLRRSYDLLGGKWIAHDNQGRVLTLLEDGKAEC